MKNRVFGQDYATYYDLLYADKDYEAECNLIEAAFRRFSSLKVEKVLDLGCGTGNHAWRLAQRGYQVIGVDLSEPMIELARRKRNNFPLPPEASPPLFLCQDVKNLSLKIKFEAVIAMFAVLGYQPNDEDVAAFLKTVAHHLKSGGLFLADVWYGPAVEAIKPEARRKIVSGSEGKVLREAKAELIPEKNLCLVHYHLIIEKNDGSKTENFEEDHLMRYFFPEKLEKFLWHAGLKLGQISAFGDLDLSPNPSTWNILIVALKP